MSVAGGSGGLIRVVDSLLHHNHLAICACRKEEHLACFLLEHVSTPRINKTTYSMVIMRVVSFILCVTVVNLEYQPDCGIEY